MQKITPFLWFDNNAEEAVTFYTSVFKNSSIVVTTYYGEGAPLPKGTVMTIQFKLEGQDFIALNGGPVFSFTPAISLFVSCENQQEVDHIWKKLTDGGEAIQCAWLKDKYGITWQIVPTILGTLLQDKDQIKATKVLQAMLRMTKINIDSLLEAYNS
jgi:predicted 3-demethylubiquinone-9 3-methyltransferase (glyoxalase superfamily)